MVGDDCEISHLTPAIALKFLRQRFVSCSGYSANRDRQILGAAWEWGRRLVEGFPNLANPFLTVERFPEDPKPRYVPLLEDFDEILDTAEGQDLVMLKAFINLAARRSEIFRLKWADVDFREGMVSLKTRKTKDGSWRVDHIPMSTELRQTLLRWWQERPIKSEYVFCMLDNAYAARHNPGDPFKSRCHFMKKLCLRAGVKAFGFHAIRHLSAVILYKAGEPLANLQKILRHQNATTTNRYLKSLGFEIEEIRSSVEVLARGAAKVIPLPQKSEAL
jgi:integrase